MTKPRKMISKEYTAFINGLFLGKAVQHSEDKRSPAILYRLVIYFYYSLFLTL